MTDFMSLQAYDIQGLEAFDMNLSPEQVKESLDNHVWVTARKKRIPVREMSTSHIKNCIRCLEGKGKLKIPATYLGGKEKWLEIFNEELTKRQ